jgi:hypothetical protein
MLYKDGMKLKDVTCPCKTGYWDIFRKAFIPGDQVREGREPSRAVYEARVKADLSDQEYEARLREQFIIHFLNCEEKRKLDISDPRNDGSTKRRAEAELEEIRNGDFTSRGRSVFRSELPPLVRSVSDGRYAISDIQRPLSDRHAVSSSRHRSERSPQEDPNVMDLPIRSGGYSQSAGREGMLETRHRRDSVPENVPLPTYTQASQGRERYRPSFDRPFSTNPPITERRPSVESREPAPRLAESFLPKVGNDFALIPRGGLAASRKFVLENPKVMDVNATLFLQSAVASLRAGLIQNTESYVEKAVLISECSNLSSRGLRDYLQDLVRDPEVRRDFDNTFNEAYKKIRKRVEESGPTSSSLATETTSAASRRSDIAASRFLGTSPDREPYRPLTSTHSARPTFSEYSTTSKTGSGDRHRTDSRSRPYFDEENPRPRSPPRIDVQGTTGDEEELDPRYKKRRDARDFFSEGRVFATLAHVKAEGEETSDSDVKFVKKNIYGEKVYRYVRQMVVVEQRERYCWCLPISTYNGFGVAKRGMTMADRQKHTIVYDNSRKPTRGKDEVDLVKKPIAVVMAPKQKLDPFSRLNFGQRISVEFNVKVMNVGKVHSDSMPYLQAYWQEEMTLQ